MDQKYCFAYSLVYLCDAHLSLFREKEFRRTMHLDMHRPLRLYYVFEFAFHLLFHFLFAVVLVQMIC